MFAGAERAWRRFTSRIRRSRQATPAETAQTTISTPEAPDVRKELLEEIGVTAKAIREKLKGDGGKTVLYQHMNDYPFSTDGKQTDGNINVMFYPGGEISQITTRILEIDPNSAYGEVLSSEQTQVTFSDEGEVKSANLSSKERIDSFASDFDREKADKIKEALERALKGRQNDIARQKENTIPFTYTEAYLARTGELQLDDSNTGEGILLRHVEAGRGIPEGVFVQRFQRNQNLTSTTIGTIRLSVDGKREEDGDFGLTVGQLRDLLTSLDANSVGADSNWAPTPEGRVKVISEKVTEFKSLLNTLASVNE